ncbi:MAG: amino acid permease [Hyphomicrobiales bacterium]|nr:amino acid permease [Hyphomicrobiales bacterium]
MSRQVWLGSDVIMEMPITPKGRLLRRINLPLLMLYGLGATIGAGIYVVIGETAASAGYYLPLAFLIAAIIAGLSAASFAELATRYPVSAGEAAYLREGLGFKGLSLVTGLAVASAGAISSATLLQGGVGYLQELIELPGPMLFVALLVLLGGFVAWGIVKSLLLTGIFTIMEIGGLALIIFYAPSDPVTLIANAAAAADAFDYTVIAGLSSAVMLAFFAFIGFEDMVNVVEEVKRPRRTMPLAIGLTLIITTLLYVWIALIAINAIAPASLVQERAPLASLFTVLSGQRGWIISVIGAFAVLNGVVIQLIMGSRVLYGLARLGQIPGIFGIVSDRTHTPLYATALICAVILIMGLLLSLRDLAQMTSALTLTVFALVNLSLIALKMRRDQPADVFKVSIIVPILGFVSSTGLLLFELIQRIDAFAG